MMMNYENFSDLLRLLIIVAHKNKVPVDYLHTLVWVGRYVSEVSESFTFREFYEWYVPKAKKFYGSKKAPPRNLVSNELGRLYRMELLSRKAIPRKTRSKSGKIVNRGREYLYSMSSQGRKYLRYVLKNWKQYKKMLEDGELSGGRVRGRKIKELNRRVRELTEMNKELKREVEYLKRKCYSCDWKNTMLNRDLENLKSEYEKVSNELKSTKKKCEDKLINRMETEIKDLRALIKKYEECMKENRVLKKENKRLKEKIYLNI